MVTRPCGTGRTATRGVADRSRLDEVRSVCDKGDLASAVMVRKLLFVGYRPHTGSQDCQRNYQAYSNSGLPPGNGCSTSDDIGKNPRLVPGAGHAQALSGCWGQR